MKVGIQGGPGSFNDEAARVNLPHLLQTDFDIVYLYTTADVLSALDEGRVDRGQFAIRNTLGGIVEETNEATKGHSFHVLAEYSLKVRHALLAARGATASTITDVMGHPQALTQCKETLARKYPHLHCVSGDGKLSDPAAVAEAISHNDLPATTAVVGSTALADQWGLQILSDNLQDSNENYTTFVLVTSAATPNSGEAHQSCS